MAAHAAPTTVHLHLHAVHPPARLSWLVVVLAAAALALVLLAVVMTGDGTLLSPDQLPQPRSLTSFGR
jgi:hypothetical protein